MKTLFKLILLLNLFSISLFANLQEIDECKNDLYYANGIMIQDSKKAASIKWNKSVKQLFSSNQEEYKKIASVKISYNVSQGFFDDLFESAEQAMSNEWGWWEFAIFFRAYLETHNLQESYDTHIPDLTTQVNAYKKSIKLGHGVIVIAHSQGNFYTNEAYEKLDDWMKDYFHMFGVATPANHVAGFPVDDAASPYVLFHNDFINFIVTALPSNLNDTRHHGFPSIDAHDFYDSYMKEITSKKMIFDFIIAKIKEHSKNDSQWELDQELNKGTKDFKITLKHRFDTTITSMQNVEVYPFKPSKKLYRVTDNTSGNGWVKASCGGEEVFDSWDGQEDNEAYMINNPEKEKIEKTATLYIEGGHGCTESHYKIINPEPNTKYAWFGWGAEENRKVSEDTLSISIPYPNNINACTAHNNSMKETSIAVRPTNGNEYYGQMFPLKIGGALIWFLGAQQFTRTTVTVRWVEYVGSHVEWSTTHGDLTVNYGNSSNDGNFTLDLGNRYVFSLNCDLKVTITAVVTPTCGNCPSYTYTRSYGICEL